MSITDVTWPIQPHTEAKHAILRSYLGAWFPILALRYSRIVYVDGFAGPGEYKGGEPGSPVIALDVAKNHPLANRFKGEIFFFFIEDDEARKKNLEKKLREITVPSNFRVQVERGSFNICIGQALSEISQKSEQLAPSFFFIDPFGVTGFPMSLIQKIAEQPKSEVLVTFNYQPLVQWFLEIPSKHNVVDGLFGTNVWREALKIGNPKQKEEFIRRLYQESLEKLGWNVRSFCMENENRQTQYYLMYATKNHQGMMAMKDAMWKSAPYKDYKYSDLSNPAQPCMFESVYENQYVKELAEAIIRTYGGKSVSKKALWEYVALHPVCRGTHLTQALRLLEYETTPPAIINVANRQKSKTYPDDCVITFSP